MKFSEEIQKSTIFSEGDKRLILKRLTGDLKDQNGQFSRRTKPKILEIIKLFGFLQQLKGLISKSVKKYGTNKRDRKI